MFCNQCEQAAKGEGCTKIGVCGKEPDIAALQDLLVHVLQGLSLYAVEGRKNGISDPEVNLFTCEATFSTLTNVNFDADRFVNLINRGVELAPDVADGPQSVILDQVTNGVAIRMALMYLVLGGK